uniref:NADH-ubiquinone oxidoreductase chain 5 n=1 Tax=Chrysolina aeruginosa TaxID=640304 RepID=A0A7H0R0D2_9CUCU|nr:NADH dehydrogenase subunit 5 [Chrysolina aeruginosa]QNQ64881.1 NADH dehydrogenase subunit 5 [Chrysolina aeruginosa]
MCKVYFSMFFFNFLVLFIFSMYMYMLDFSLVFEYVILNLNSSSIFMTILLDWMSLVFMSFVMFISCMVIFYSEEYMMGDLNLNRFILLVVMFVVSMMLMIISPNLISILLGWDGLGLVSYCLVIYYQNVKSYNAGMLTALSNRVGDVALLMSIAWMMNYGSWNFYFYIDMMKSDFEMSLISLLVILAALTKSAQIPFSSWLPAAMAAPTPVSSLVHSSTLVTAGVYLLIRFNFALSPWMCYLLLFVSSMTMFMSGLGANFEFDLKKIIALSTLSQLGLMMSILCLGQYELAFFHLLTHALFKALLFMCSGSIIHNFNSIQDIRFFGGLINLMPLTLTFFMICNFSLCGLPFFSGFYSKDLIVEFMSMSYLNIYIYIIYYLSVGLTVSYSFRLAYYLIFGDFNYLSMNSLSENKSYMMKGMEGLILMVIFMGSILSWLFFSKPIYICLPLIFKLMTLIMIFAGIIIGSIFFEISFSYTVPSSGLMKIKDFISFMWNMPYISTSFITKLPLSGGMLYCKIMDQGWFEYYGNFGIGKLIKYIISIFQGFSLNHLKVNFMMILIWLFFLIIYL